MHRGIRRARCLWLRLMRLCVRLREWRLKLRLRGACKLRLSGSRTLALHPLHDGLLHHAHHSRHLTKGGAVDDVPWSVRSKNLPLQVNCRGLYWSVSDIVGQNMKLKHTVSASFFGRFCCSPKAMMTNGSLLSRSVMDRTSCSKCALYSLLFTSGIMTAFGISAEFGQHRGLRQRNMQDILAAR